MTGQRIFSRPKIAENLRSPFFLSFNHFFFNLFKIHNTKFPEVYIILRLLVLLLFEIKVGIFICHVDAFFYRIQWIQLTCTWKRDPLKCIFFKSEVEPIKTNILSYYLLKLHCNQRNGKHFCKWEMFLLSR